MLAFTLTVAEEDVRFMTMQFPVERFIIIGIPLSGTVVETVVFIPTSETPTEIQWKLRMFANILWMARILQSIGCHKILNKSRRQI